MTLFGAIKVVQSTLATPGKIIFVTPNTIYCDGTTYATIADAMARDGMGALYALLEEARA